MQTFEEAQALESATKRQRTHDRIPMKSTELKAIEAIALKLGQLEDALAESRVTPPTLNLPSQYNWSTTERVAKSYQAAALALSGRFSRGFSHISHFTLVLMGFI